MCIIGIYTYGGSGNHGCEALLITLRDLLSEGIMVVYTQRPEDDKRYLCDFPGSFVKANRDLTLFEKILMRISKPEQRIFRTYSPIIEGSKTQNIMISIGGDNYCYRDFRRVPGIIRKGFDKATKTVLFGCSIEKEALEDTLVLDDLRQYDLITARETLTFTLLKETLPDNRIELYPDSAFLLEPAQDVNLPCDGEFVGLNLSPMVTRFEKNAGEIVNNIYDMIRDILENTQLKILLVPHVVWQGHDDRVILNEIYRQYEHTGRVFLAEDDNCSRLKSLIAQCRFFIGARTHATIAAYSSCVPTITFGYSIKSRGIAIDLFGTSENYVIPVQEMRAGDLVRSFHWLMENEDMIRARLKSYMPEYKAAAQNVQSALFSVLRDTDQTAIKIS